MPTPTTPTPAIAVAICIERTGARIGRLLRLGDQITDGGFDPMVGEYRIGDAVTVGPVHVRIDGIHGSGAKDIAVDVTLS